MKKIVIACLISSVVALGIAGGAGWGIYHSMTKGTATAADKPAHEAEDSQDESSSIFVSLPETVVTLHDNEDRYMVAELVMVVDSEKDAEKIKKDEPLYQSITVDELSNMKYEDIRALKISDIRKKVFENLKTELAKRKMATPYKDILVKKVVFQ